MNDELFALDKRRLRQGFDRAAPTYAQFAILQREVRTRLLERLTWIRLNPRCIIDLGCGTGAALPWLAQRYPRAQVFGLDLALAMAQQARGQRRWLRRRPGIVCADMERLPLRTGTIDLAVSVAALQWITALDDCFAEVRRSLAPGGLWLFATFGPATLHELRTAFAHVEKVPLAHVNAFLDMHDIGDALVRAGFADPVMDQETLTVTYPDFASLLRDLRGVGVRNALIGRPRGLTSPRHLAAVAAAYAERFGHEGRLPQTWEVVYGHAWVPDTPPPTPLPPRHIPIFPQRP